MGNDDGINDFIDWQNKSAHVLYTAHKQLEILRDVRSTLIEKLKRTDAIIKKHINIIEEYTKDN